MKEEVLTMEQPIGTLNPTGLFDEHGRRIPYPGMRVYAQVSRRYYFLNQPTVDYGQIYDQSAVYLPGSGNAMQFSLTEFQVACEDILEALAQRPEMANLAKAVWVPFICLQKPQGLGWEVDTVAHVSAAGEAFTDQFPRYAFYNNCKGLLDDDADCAAGSRYRSLDAARCLKDVVGLWFPNCVSEFDLDSQRAQMATLPRFVHSKAGKARIVLSGIVEAAAGLVGCPGLLRNETNYPHHLCLSAIQDPDERFFYSFEADGMNLVFTRRTNMLTPTVKQLSEQFAGGLTVFVTL